MNATLFSGTANPDLARAVARELEIELARSEVVRFPDGEVSVRLGVSVRGENVFVLQPTANPVDANIIELLAFGDACTRAACGRLTAVIPYFGYARGDHRKDRNEPIMAGLVARLIEAAGFQHVVAVDLHSAALEGFFQIPVENLSCLKLFCDALKPRLAADAVIASPDLGRAAMAMAVATELGLSVAIVHKRRSGPRAVEALHVMGDVKDRPCIIVDDMISTGGTVIQAAGALTGKGARAVSMVAATHAVLVPDALADLHAAGFTDLIVTDTIHAHPCRVLQTRIVSVAPLLAETLRRLSGD
jgi:ribose-phosphate pyrophosphokinase